MSNSIVLEKMLMKAVVVDEVYKRKLPIIEGPGSRVLGSGVVGSWLGIQPNPSVSPPAEWRFVFDFRLWFLVLWFPNF